MKVLAIDPGSRMSGYAVLEKQGKKIIYHASGVFKFKEEPFLERIPKIREDFQELTQKFAPDHVALESLIFVKNPSSLMKLAQTRGIILSAVMSEKTKVFEYSPNLIKATVTGYGHSDKLAVQKCIITYLGLEKFQSHDESDALAIGLCHLLSFQEHNQLKGLDRVQTKSRSLASSLRHRLKEPVL